MPTKNQLISDIKLRLTKGSPSDDLELEDSQVAFWASSARDAIVKQYLEAKIKSGKPIDNFYILKESNKILLQEVDATLTPDRVFIRLNNSVLELTGDRGIYRVITDEGQFVYQTNLRDFDIINTLEWTVPGETNLVYHREGGDKLIISGVPDAEEDDRKFVVWYIPSIDINCLQDNDEVLIADELLPQLQELVYQIAREQMFGGHEDVENDSSQKFPE